MAVAFLPHDALPSGNAQMLQNQWLLLRFRLFGMTTSMTAAAAGTVASAAALFAAFDN